jgi:hypothetical protein
VDYAAIDRTTQASTRTSALRMLSIPLLAYALLAGALAWAQRGFFNADFVAYATVARRLLTDPASSITAYWSPLFSWLMAPLLSLGLSDLLAGRLVLLAAGGLYLVGVCLFALRFAPQEGPPRRFFFTSATCCAVLQGALWANHFLNPDLLANAILFPYLILLWHPRPLANSWRPLAAGALAGLAYLAKAYMLPFLLLQLPLVLLLSRSRRRAVGANGSAETTAPTTRRRLQDGTVVDAFRGLALFGLGLSLAAGFWILILSRHHGHFTLSTAGPANHANVGPDCFRLDPLWNPSLEAGFILNPHYGPDWSPLASMRNFKHQIYVVGYNTLNALGHLSGWLAMLVVAAAWRLHARKVTSPLASDHRRALVFLSLTLLCYVSGYALINLEARYLVPTMAPPLCLMALILVSPVLTPRLIHLSGIAPFLLAVVLTLPFAAQDLSRAWKVAVKHPQSAPLEPYLRVAHELSQHGWLDRPFAASTWHGGLDVAYASHAIPLYLGRPKDESRTARAAELEGAGAQLYLDFVPVTSSVSIPLPESSWSLRLSVPLTSSRRVDVYVRVN